MYILTINIDDDDHDDKNYTSENMRKENINFLSVENEQKTILILIRKE
jgi:hypothetical protein